MKDPLATAVTLKYGVVRTKMTDIPDTFGIVELFCDIEGKVLMKRMALEIDEGTLVDLQEMLVEMLAATFQPVGWTLNGDEVDPAIVPIDDQLWEQFNEGNHTDD